MLESSLIRTTREELSASNLPSINEKESIASCDSWCRIVTSIASSTSSLTKDIGRTPVPEMKAVIVVDKRYRKDACPGNESRDRIDDQGVWTARVNSRLG